MKAADAEEILGLNTGASKEGNVIPSGGLTDLTKKIHKKNRNDAVFKRPEGMHRELYNLLDGEKSAAVLMPSTSKNEGYRRQKARMGMRRVHPWIWAPFENEARKDNFCLYHWQRVDKKMDEYPFARFNKELNIPAYTDEEYDQCLNSAKWTKTDTDHLFSLCRRFDTRWPIIVDRWEGSTKRTMEEMKERYYNAVNELNALHNNMVEFYSFDAEHEKRRKEQLIKLWNRTREEVEEEEMLTEELRKIEIRKKERERKAQDLQKFIASGDRHTPSSLNTGASSKSSSLKKKTTIRIPKAPTPYSTTASAAFISDHFSLRFPEFRSAGAHLRSQEMKLPTNIGQRKLKNIETVMEKLKLDMVPVGAEEIVGAYNEFRSSIVLLQELKHTLQTAEYELESLRSRYSVFVGKTFDIEPRMRVRSASESQNETLQVGGEGMPSSRRTITDMIELTTAIPQMVSFLQARKRKLPSHSSSSSPGDVKKLRKT